MPIPIPTTPPSTVPTGDIIPDSQFKQALPQVDPALSQPLAPFESIDSLPSVQTTDPTVPSAKAWAPSVLPTTLLGIAVSDPALAQPLPPIASFQVEPPAVTVANAQADDKAPPIAYTVKVEGLDEVELEDRFRALSALNGKGRKAANGAVITARATEDEALALRLMRSEGYYDGVASSLVEPVQGQPGRATATISASPGTRYALGTIT
ncbi:MAG: hypothetical protein ABIQ19_09225, partial [Sphingomonas sp.]